MRIFRHLFRFHAPALALICYPSFAHAASQLNYIAAGINSSGEIVGAVCPNGTPYGGGQACLQANSQGGFQLLPSSAAISQNGIIQQLDVGGCGFAGGEFGSIAVAVSESGSILVLGPGPNAPVSTELSCLLTPLKSGGYKIAPLNFIGAGINSSGEIVGAVCPNGTPYGGGQACLQANSQGGFQLLPSSAAISQNGIIQQLDVGGCGFAGGEFGSIAVAVSESGSILVLGPGPNAPVSTELSCLLTPLKSGGYKIAPLNFIGAGINSSGEIVGAVCPNGTPYGGGQACLQANSQGGFQLLPSSAAISQNGIIQQLDVGGCGFAGGEFGSIAVAVSESGSILVLGPGPNVPVSTELSCLLPGAPSIVAGQAAASVSASPSPFVMLPTFTGNVPGLHPPSTGYYSLYVGCSAGSAFLAGCKLTAKVTGMADAGGHDHDNGMRPLGEIVCGAGNTGVCTDGTADLTDAGTSPTEAGGPLSSITFTTKSTQVPVILAYQPPQIGGDVTLLITDNSDNPLPTVQWTLHITTASAGGGCQQNNLQTFCLLDGGAAYALTGGGAGAHPINHYGTPTFLGVLSNLATTWFNHVQPPLKTVPPLAINDMSLIDGGMFDLNALWSSGAGHKWHRWGDMADIGSGSPLPSGCVLTQGQHPITCWLPPSARGRLWLDLIIAGYPPIIENLCTSVQSSSCTHWHIEPASSVPILSP